MLFYLSSSQVLKIHKYWWCTFFRDCQRKSCILLHIVIMYILSTLTTLVRRIYDGEISTQNRAHFHKLPYFARAVMTSYDVMCICTFEIHLKKIVRLRCNYHAIRGHFKASPLFVADIKKKLVECKKAKMPCKTRWDSWKCWKYAFNGERGKKKCISSPPPPEGEDVK